MKDVETILTLIADLGGSYKIDRRTASSLRVPKIRSDEASYELVRAMRASILVLGPLVARFGKAVVALPGGCAIGSRPIDLHIAGLQKLGATISLEHGYIRAEADRLRGAEIVFEKKTVTGHGEPAHGRRPGQGRDDPQELRPRARGRRPGRAPQQDGRQDRLARRGHGPHPRRQASSAGRPTPSSPTGSRPAPSSSPGP